jgi:DUF4097 and DUF4098 domain-containing protein YvlB
MNIITRRLAMTVAAAAFAAPVFAQSQHAGIDEMARAAERIAREAARMAHSSGWAAKSWEESRQAKQGPETTERITKSFKVGATGSLDLAAISGDVVVREGGADTITVDAIKRVRSRSAGEAKQQLANTGVNMSQAGNRVEVRVNYTGRNNHASVDFEVTAPAGTAVNARSISGDVQVKNIRGDVRVESVSGSVSAIGTPNLSSIRTVSGNLELAGLAINDDLAVSTISGDMKLRNIKARVVNAESVSGEMTLTDITCDRATVKSVSGGIDYVGPLARNGRYEMKTHSGDIRLTMPTEVGFELEAQTFSGEVRSDLPVTTRAGGSLMGGGGPGRHRGLRGTHGDGGVLLVLGTFSGDITVVKGK